MRDFDTTICLLPGGYTDREGVRHREAELRGFTGREEEILAARGAESSAVLVTEILTRCLVRIGTVREVTHDIARELLVADRQYLLLKLRALTFGDTVRTTVRCAVPHCGNRIDIDFSLDDIPIRELEGDGPFYSMELSAESALETYPAGHCREIWYRLPNGGDQEVVSPLVATNESAALSLLLERCIGKIGPFPDPGREFVSKLSPMARLEIERAMETVAPKLDLAMSVVCPECRTEFEIPFNLQEMFFGEFSTNLDTLYREVHSLAFHYHWSEQEILEMAGKKRARYLEILADELERMNSGS